ncbi:MAG: methyl-accepting chemotaxis protein [Pseudomonadota bacterium]
MAEPVLLSSKDKATLMTTLRDLRNAHGFALNAAAIFIEVATAQDDAARIEVAQQFKTFSELYAKTIRSAVACKTLALRPGKSAKLIEAALETDKRFQALDATAHYANVTAKEAGELVHFVRLEGVPAIMQLAALLGEAKKSHDKAVSAVMQERIGQLDKMFTEVEDIGRMIHMISLNASVEAARAGGESGRSFKVIADEIRALAQQAAVLIDTTRSGVLPGTEQDILAGERV